MSKPRLLFFAGGECLTRHGVLVQRTSIDEDVAETFTRTGTASMSDPSGRLLSAAANVPRVAYPLVDGVRTPALLLEATRTNLVTSLDISAWTSNNTPVVTGGQADPAGGTAAYLIEDDSGTDVDFKHHTLSSFSGDGVKALSIFVREGPNPNAECIIKLRDTSAGADRAILIFTGWTDGEPTVSQSVGTRLAVEEWSGGWWRILWQTTAVTAANGHRLEIAPAGYTGSETGDIYVYWPQAENASAPSSPIAASGTRNDETFYAPYTHVPQEMTVYVKFVERGTNLIGSGFPRILDFGGTDPSLRIFADAGGNLRYRATWDDGSVAQTTPDTGTDVADVGDVVEIVVQFTGTVATLYQSIGGATAQTSGSSSAGGEVSAFGTSRVYVGSSGSSQYGLADFLSVKVAAGSKTLAEMRNA